MTKIWMVSPLLLAGWSAPAWAEEVALVDRASIIVTASGNLAPSDSDQVLAQDLILDLQQGFGERVENRLRDVAGLGQFRRSDSRSAHPTSQGMTLRGLGGNASSRALVTLDGVPQADPFGGWIAWSAYDAVRLGGISIARGGGSGADGAGALAGTIALHSEMTSGVAGSLAYGSRDSWDASLNLGTNLGAGAVSLDGRYARGDGFTPIVKSQRGAVDRPAPYEQGGVGLRARFDAGGHGRVEASVRAFRDERDRGVDYTQSQISGVDASLRMVDEAPDAAQWSALAYVQVRELESGFSRMVGQRESSMPSLFQRVPATGMGLRGEVRPLISGAHPLRLGADWRRTVGRTDEDYSFSGLVANGRRIAGGSSDVAGLFAEWTGGAAEADGLLWTLSGRLDHWRLGEGYRNEDLAGEAPVNLVFAARSNWEGSGRAGLRWKSGDVALRGAAYRGWRLPTLNELYRPFRVGADTTFANEALVPERLWGGDVGADWANDRARLSLTLFANHLDNAIANVTIADSNNNRRENLDAIKAKGAEVSGGYDFGPIAADFSYAFTDAKVKSAVGDLDGQRPAQLPKHMASFSLRGNKDSRIGGFWTMRYIGPQYEDDIGALRLKGVVTADAGVSLRLTDQWMVEARGENLFDAMVPAAISSTGLIERALPRTIWLGLRFGM